MEQTEIVNAVVERLRSVIDPETGVDVILMRLVQDIQVDEDGLISYVFRPSSPLCPLAVQIALDIIEAVKQVPGIKQQKITVVDYVQADLLNEILKSVV